MHNPWKRLTTLVASATLIACSGTVLGLQPEKSDRKDQPNMEKGPREKQMRTLVFTSGKKINGSTVKNSDNKTLGTVDDMVIDRGSGQIDFLVVKTGAILGMGGKDVAVPYHQMGWDNIAHVATLAATPEEIKTWPEFNRAQWKEGAKTETVRVMSQRYYDNADSPWPNEAKFDKTTTIKGKVKTITRRDVGGNREEALLIVQSDRGGGGDQEVILGPSWYMSGNNSTAIFRDADIEADTFSVERSGKSMHMTRAVRVNGKEVVFYDAQGRAMWAPSSTTTTTEKITTNYAPMPQVLFTDLKGKNVLARGEKCGEIDDVIVECRSGRVAFLSLDPDKNFLGIGDESRLVPWTLMTSSTFDNKAHIDSSKTMLQNAPTVPKDLETLADGGLYQRVYSAFDVPPFKFSERRGGERRHEPKD